jgi:hypothetical protein
MLASAIASRRRISFRRRREIAEARGFLIDMTTRNGTLLAFGGGSAMRRDVKFRARTSTNKKP